MVLADQSNTPGTAVQGDLTRYPLPRLMYYLYKKRFMGRLELKSVNGHTSHVYFRDGFPAYVEVPTREDVLGLVLLEQGSISQAQYDESLELFAQGGQLHGQILLQMGAIDSKQLIGGLNAQLRRKLNRLFARRGEQFALQATDHERGTDPEGMHVRADPLMVIYQGVRNSFDGPLVAQELNKLENAEIRLRPDAAKLLPRYGIGPDEQGVIVVLGAGPISMARLCQQSNLSPTETQMLLYALWVTEALAITPHDGTRSEQHPPAARPVVVPPAPGPYTIRKAALDLGREVPVPPTAARGAQTAASSDAGRRSDTDPARAQAAEQLRELIAEKFAHIGDQNHFEVLGIDRKASVQTARDRYFELAKQFHPDRVNALGLGDLAGQAAEIFRKISEANAVLTDPAKRDQYARTVDQTQEEIDEARSVLEAEMAFQKGMVFFRKKDFRQALAHFKESYRLNPKEGEHVAWVAWTQFCDPRTDKKSLLPELRDNLRAAVDLSPRSAVSHYYLGEIHLALGDTKRAVASFTRATDIKPDHVDALRHLRLIRMRDEHSHGKASKGLFSRFRKK